MGHSTTSDDAVVHATSADDARLLDANNDAFLLDAADANPMDHVEPKLAEEEVAAHPPANNSFFLWENYLCVNLWDFEELESGT